MISRKYGLLTAIALAAIPCAASAQAPAGVVQASALKAAATETAVRRAYEAADWHRIWNAASRTELDDALAHRNRHGLDHINFLQLDAANGSPEAADIAYTHAALDYAAALARGHVDPSSLHEVYTVARPHIDLGKGLVAAVRGGTLARWLDGLAPSDSAYAALSNAYVAASRVTAEQQTAIASSKTLQLGDTDPRVADIAKQLIDDGYLDSAPASAAKGTYSQPIVDAVKALQGDYGISQDGILGPDTLAVLNLRPQDRTRALAVALERRRWLSRTPPATRIDVNTAAAELRYFRDGQLIDTRKVIVGEPGRETPALGSPIYRLVANPTWTIPKSIQTTELAHVGSGYLRAHNMQMRDGWIVQQPGPDNALGLVKFDMRNDQAIYLHDTSAPSLFDRSQRHLSHGCVRVEDATGFAEMLADQEGVGDAWRTAHDSGDYTIVDLPREIPVRLLYHDVFVDDGGKVTFRTDPYGWNEAVATKLGFGGGDTKRAKAEAIDIGP